MEWTHRDFTQIKERRPEGAEVDWELEEEASAFSFLWRGAEEDGEKEEMQGEFEFSNVMAGSTAASSVVERPGMSSPADELFFKGQLLPLHLPPRIQMVKKLVLERPAASGKAETATQARFARLFEAAAPARAWWEGQECSSSSCESSGDSSSSRDSNGSSQDCFESGTAKDGADGKGFFHNREVFTAQSAHPADRRASGISTWLRPPFKWKVLFGAKKAPSLKPYDVEATLFPPADRYYSDCSGELTHSGDLLLSGRALGHARGMERAKGYLMRALNLNRSKEHPPRAISTSKSFPPFSQSFRFSPKDHIPLRSVKRPPPPPSPSPTPRVSTSSPSSELHCDIKGAIAHCKESQKQADDAKAAASRQWSMERSTTWKGYAPPTAANRATYKPGVAWDKAQPRVRDHTRRPQPVHTGCHPAFKPKVEPITQHSQYNAYLDNMHKYSTSVPGLSTAYGRVQNIRQSKSFLNPCSR